MFLLTKRVGETLQNVGIDFTDRLLTSEGISSGTVTCATSGIVSGAVATTTTLTADLAAGSDAGEYVIEYVATGDLGSIMESQVLLCVLDI